MNAVEELGLAWQNACKAHGHAQAPRLANACAFRLGEIVTAGHVASSDLYAFVDELTRDPDFNNPDPALPEALRSAVGTYVQAAGAQEVDLEGMFDTDAWQSEEGLIESLFGLAGVNAPDLTAEEPTAAPVELISHSPREVGIFLFKDAAAETKMAKVRVEQLRRQAAEQLFDTVARMHKVMRVLR